jgi:hypothetical protein
MVSILVLNAKPFNEKTTVRFNDKIPINRHVKLPKWTTDWLHHSTIPVKLTKWTTDWLHHSTIHQCNSVNRIGNTKMKQEQKRTVPSLRTNW